MQEAARKTRRKKVAGRIAESHEPLLVKIGTSSEISHGNGCAGIPEIISSTIAVVEVSGCLGRSDMFQRMLGDGSGLEMLETVNDMVKCEG
ncbi:hypothetical protein AgCh_021574 [Apium graveolens]